ncbi:MAG: UDP-4-amino-4,6-dideoxy-N-acetyl-beta-L-altrosami ne transaminase [Deferrisomatales bacterium]
MTRLPYGRQCLDAADEAAVLRALRSAWLTQGPGVEAFEEALAEAVGARHAVAVSSGTAALHLLYLALGVGPGDTVCTSPVTFLATANAALYCGARPAFADVDPETACLDPEALEARLEAGLRPKVVAAVHYAGLPCDLARLGALAERFGFVLVEDACHALGARYRLDDAWGPVGDGRASRAAVFSFHPLKAVTTGEGGAVVTNDPELAERVRRLRAHGAVRGGDPERPWRYEMRELGFNYRITDLQCALGRSQLDKLASFVERRARLARLYRRALADLEARDLLALPVEPPGRASAWHLFAVRLPRDRDRMHRELAARGIGTQVHYTPVHLQPYYRERFGTGAGDCPAAERYAARTLSLPLFPAMGDRDVGRVVEALRALLGGDP